MTGKWKLQKWGFSWAIGRNSEIYMTFRTFEGAVAFLRRLP